MIHRNLTDVPDEAERISKELIRISATGAFEELREEMTHRLLAAEFLTGDPETQLYRRMLSVAVMQNLAATIQIMADEISGTTPAPINEQMEPPC